jgi:predicted HNH restriction endonuclease
MPRDQKTAPHVLRATRYWLVPGAKNASHEDSIRSRERWPLIVRFSGDPDGIAKVVAGGVTKRHLWQVERHKQLIFDTSEGFEKKFAELMPGVTAHAMTNGVESEEEESRFAEGAAQYKLHRQLERDTDLAKKVKAKSLANDGRLKCEVCRFDFVQSYGELGSGFIEAHHTVPVSKLDGSTRTRESDLVLVCSNCHRMLHKGGRLLSVNELRALWRANGET